MRRLSSILTSLALAAGAVAIASPVAHAAGGTIKTVQSPNYSPSSLSNAAPQRMVRLEKSNEFLVMGRNTATAGSNFHLWKMKEDLTFNTSFGVVDLGAKFSAPTASNSNCVTNSGTSCANVQSLTVNENTDTFVAVLRRQLKGSGSSSSTDRGVLSVVTGKISTGAVIAQGTYLDNGDGMRQYSESDWSSYGAVEISKAACTTVHGASINGAPLNWAWANWWNLAMRPDGSIAVNVDCEYNNNSNMSQAPVPDVKQYEATLMTAFKPSAGGFVVDTSFATNGYLKVSNPLTECAFTMPGNTTDLSITSMSSTKTFMLVSYIKTQRSTTVPSGWQSITSYDGCDNHTPGSAPANSTVYTSMQVNGKLKKSATYSSVSLFGQQRWIIDPQGRWNSVTTFSSMNAPSMNAPSTTPSLIRILPDGSPDTSLGANGTKELTGLPASVTVNGTSIPLRYSVSGLAQTSSESLFVGFASSGSLNCGSNPTTGTVTNTIYPYYFSVEKGLITTYGNNGVGDSLVTLLDAATSCNGTSLGGVTYINSEGRPAVVRATAAIGQQPAGIAYAVWDAPEGVIGGGDGTASAGASGRVDKKVYSTRLPKATQTDSAVQVLSSRQARDLDIRTNTPKICVALTTSVLMVNPGRCSVRIIDEDTQKVIRTMVTIVKKSEVEVGTVLTTDEPIYFKQANTKLSKTALEQVKELADASADAARVVVIGHSAALGEVSQYSYAISRNRANAVKAALIKAGVKAPIEVVALAYNQPEKTAKTEKAQALNRRAEVFIFPK